MKQVVGMYWMMSVILSLGAWDRQLPKRWHCLLDLKEGNKPDLREEWETENCSLVDLCARGLGRSEKHSMFREQHIVLCAYSSNVQTDGLGHKPHVFVVTGFSSKCPKTQTNMGCLKTGKFFFSYVKITGWWSRADRALDDIRHQLISICSYALCGLGLMIKDGSRLG